MKRAATPKQVSALDAIRALPPVCRIMITQACGTPLTLMQAIDDGRGHFESLEVCTGLLFEDLPWVQRVGENISVTTWQVSGPIQKAADEGRVEYLPLRLSQVPWAFGRSGPFPVDAAVIQVSQPDANGYVSLGATVGTIMEIAREAPFVIAEVNAQTPRTLGNSFLHLRDIDLLVDADYPVIQRKGTPIGESERRIAESVAELVPDGATIQTGIGAIPEALIGLLEGKRDLGVHSGMISDGYINLIERGIINNTKKSFDKHKLVIGEVMGTAELFRYVNDNAAIHFDSVSYTHNPNLVQRHDNFVSINSAVEIDLGGQVGAESIGPRQISGIGGQFDFVEAALHSKGGISVFAMPSTAAGGKVSRIVPQLSAGTIVSTPRYCTDYVVTEYGVASLKGKTMRQRAEALTAIAHPSFRDGLDNGLR